MTVFGLQGNTQIRARALTALPLIDFTGGLNLSNDLGTILDTEATEACNVDFQRGGGFCQRDPMLAIGDELPSPVCNMGFAENYDPFLDEDEQPRSIVYTMLENGEVWGLIYQPDGSTVTTGPIPSIETDAECPRHIQINFRQYFYSEQACASCVDGLNGQVLPWETSPDYIEPDVANGVLGANGVTGFPKASYMTVHGGFAWAAGVVDPETGEYNCNRVWRSWPLIDGEGEQNWGENDWVDIDPGFDGDCITGIVSCGSELYVFKSHSIYRIDGYSENNLTVTPICGDIGAANCDAIICCNCRTWFWDSRSGLNVLTSEGVTRAFGKLDRLLDDEIIDCGLPDLPRVGCCGDKIMVSLPSSGSTENDVTYVLDQTTGAWTKYDVGFRAFYDVCPQNFKGTSLGATNKCNHLVEICKQSEECLDDWGCSKSAINTRVASGWYNAGNPWSNKQWCTPELVVECSTKTDQTMVVRAQVDYLTDTDAGVIEVDLSDPRDLTPFTLDQSRLATTRMEQLVPGGPLTPTGCKRPSPRLGKLEEERIKKKACGPVLKNCNACVMRLVFEGPPGDWCVCGVMILYREEPITCL